eukprot:scaffold1027_cov413-Prasinococcus_capsulatus_cf.AAC.10
MPARGTIMARCDPLECLPVVLTPACCTFKTLKECSSASPGMQLVLQETYDKLMRALHLSVASPSYGDGDVFLPVKRHNTLVANSLDSPGARAIEILRSSLSEEGVLHLVKYSLLLMQSAKSWKLRQQAVEAVFVLVIALARSSQGVSPPLSPSLYALIESKPTIMKALEAARYDKVAHVRKAALECLVEFSLPLGNGAESIPMGGVSESEGLAEYVSSRAKRASTSSLGSPVGQAATRSPSHAAADDARQKWRLDRQAYLSQKQTDDEGVGKEPTVEIYAPGSSSPLTPDEIAASSASNADSSAKRAPFMSLDQLQGSMEVKEQLGEEAVKHIASSITPRLVTQDSLTAGQGGPMTPWLSHACVLLPPNSVILKASFAFSLHGLAHSSEQRRRAEG